MLEIVYSRNCVYQTAYHVVWCPKYRRSILVGDIASFFRNFLLEVCEKNGWKVIAMEVQPDHVHLFVSISPAVSVANAVKILKGTSARKLFQEFPKIKQKLWGGHLWAPSYYVGTAGNVSAKTISQYIERTEHIKGRR